MVTPSNSPPLPVAGPEPDWVALRAGFPVVRDWHYLNTPAAGSIHDRVVAAATRQYRQHAAQGDLLFLEDWLPRLEAARASAARLLGTTPARLGFVQSTSHAMNILARMVAAEVGPEKRRVVTLAEEFPATTLPFLHHGFELHFVQPDGHTYDPGAIAAAVDERTAAVVVSQVQYATGFHLDIAALGRALEGAMVRRIVNCTQAAGQVPVKLDEWGFHGAAATGHKWVMSGFGNGMLQLSDDWREAVPPPDLGWLGVPDPMRMDNQDARPREDAAAHELGCPALPNRFALGEAANLLLELGVEHVAAHNRRLADRLAAGLEARGYPVAGDRATGRFTGTVSFSCPDPAGLTARLREARVVVIPRGEGLIRSGVHCYNDDSDVDALLEAL